MQAAGAADAAEELDRYGITNELCEFVSGLTYSTFRSVATDLEDGVQQWPCPLEATVSGKSDPAQGGLPVHVHKDAPLMRRGQ